MPETTIRDIIVADIDQLFSKRKREDDTKQDMEWWRSTPSYEVQSNALARVQIIEAERNALLTRLLGENWDKGRTEQQRTPLVLAGPVLGNLSDEVKASVQDVATQSRDRVSAYLAEREAKGERPSVAELARIREETRQQLAAVLNPQQLEEFLLRYSENASRLRKELTGFNPTSDEFRSVFRVVDQIDREIQLRSGGDDLAAQRARQNLEQQRLAAIRNVVGAERFEAYQTAQDPAYHEALVAAQKAGGSDETAMALYEIQKATADELNRIRSDTTLTLAQKQQLLRDAQQEQEKARALVLGESLPAEPAAVPAPPQPPVLQHVMEPFENLALLSMRYGVRFSDLLEANPGVDVIHRVPPGTVIIIPRSVGPPPFPYPPGVAPGR
jgi:LysM repeat protein